METRGPTSTTPSGTGRVTKKGYLRVFDKVQGRQRMWHVLVWEQNNGPVPAGYQIHHVDYDKLNNDISNLQLVDPVVHKRIHSGCELRDGIWWKPCKVCHEFKPIGPTDWYFSKEGWPLYGRCRPCHISAVVRQKQERRGRLRGPA